MREDTEIKKLRLVVKRSWGQISVKDFDSTGCNNKDIEMLAKYARDTWKDFKSTEIKIVQG